MKPFLPTVCLCIILLGSLSVVQSAESRMDSDNTLEPAPAPPVMVAPAPVPVAATESSSLVLWLTVLVLLSAALILAMRKFRRPGNRKTLPTVDVPEAWLEDLSGLSGERIHVLGTKPMMLGRSARSDPARFDHLLLPKPTVGREHAEVEQRDGGYWIRDHNSVNGTFINGERLTGTQRLSHGDRIRIHQYELEFCLSGLGDDNKQSRQDAQDPESL